MFWASNLGFPIFQNFRCFSHQIPGFPIFQISALFPGMSKIQLDCWILYFAKNVIPQRCAWCISSARNVFRLFNKHHQSKVLGICWILYCAKVVTTKMAVMMNFVPLFWSPVSVLYSSTCFVEITNFMMTFVVFSDFVTSCWHEMIWHEWCGLWTYNHQQNS